jgi:hypothetical protein
MCSRRSCHAAPQSQPSEISATSESENQEESSPTSETSQDSLTQEEPPVPASRPLSLSPTSIDVLGTRLRCVLFVPYVDTLANRKARRLFLSVGTAATAASLVSCSPEPPLNSGLGSPNSPGVQGSQQSTTPSPVSDQAQVHSRSRAQRVGWLA